MAGYGARIAHARRSVRFCFGRWWRVAGEAGEKNLSESTQRLCTCVECLENGQWCHLYKRVDIADIRKGLARVSFEL